MSFEELDNKFEKIAQTPRKTDIKKQEEREQSEVEEKTKYETKFDNPGLTGLLAAFQEKLKNRNPEGAESDNFETVNLTSHSVVPSQPQPTQEEVSEEQIDGLLNKDVSNISEELEVEQTISKLRYEDGHPSIDNRPSIHDVASSYSAAQPPPQVNTPQSGYSQGRQIADEEVARQLAIHNQKKTEAKAQKAIESDASENTETE